MRDHTFVSYGLIFWRWEGVLGWDDLTAELHRGDTELHGVLRQAQPDRRARGDQGLVGFWMAKPEQRLGVGSRW
ncbi:MAG: hypothetical protein R2764_25320 [Bacteroidales bacterium]